MERSEANETRGTRQGEKRRRERGGGEITGVAGNEDQRHSSVVLVESRHFPPRIQSGGRQTATDKCYP